MNYWPDSPTMNSWSNSWSRVSQVVLKPKLAQDRGWHLPRTFKHFESIDRDKFSFPSIGAQQIKLSGVRQKYRSLGVITQKYLDMLTQLNY